MPDYFHSALRGEQIHEAKIKVLPANSNFPVPEWEGQFLVIGTNLYFSIKQNNALTWIAPKATNLPQLPSNVVTFESGYENPPTPRTKSGIIYLNVNTKDVWYWTGGAWIKLGQGTGNSTLDIISGRSPDANSGNYFDLQNPAQSIEENCLIIKKWLANTKYYFTIKSPTISSVGGSDNNLFYVALWNGYNQSFVLSTHLENSETSFKLDSSVFVGKPEPLRLGIYLRKNSNNLHLNFEFNLDTRLITIKQLSTIFFVN